MISQVGWLGCVASLGCFALWSCYRGFQFYISQDHIVYFVKLKATLPPIIMEVKSVSSNSSFLSFARVVFFFHDYGRKGNTQDEFEIMRLYKFVGYKLYLLPKLLEERNKAFYNLTIQLAFFGWDNADKSLCHNPTPKKAAFKETTGPVNVGFHQRPNNSQYTKVLFDQNGITWSYLGYLFSFQSNLFCTNTLDTAWSSPSLRTC